ncbi:TetR/AcrR family transcriptional regulator [Pseudovibrio sp. Alg231-02]|uniref:TetR/AcrR family transcriptional regulator n=1 Tax=Pseudovibrio sp. Alg231-02 TaxID=1922223 RepID=UPI000D54FAB6|nr:TetR/AcrR family transcriptional regulator [Pseudovibrio sp. Alg231-02]
MGRPRNFNRDEALQAAINVFWRKGYDGASMKDLTTAMGINSPSLYSVFGDKHQLYLEAIDRYSNDDGCAPLVAFETEPDIKKAVVAFMRSTIDYASNHESGSKGCFLGNCVSTTVGQVEGTTERLQGAITGADERLASRFDKEKELGNLPADFPSLERARLMFDLRQGQVLRARAELDQDTTEAGLAFRAKMILAV